MILLAGACGFESDPFPADTSEPTDAYVGEVEDLGWTVEHLGQDIGVLTVGHTDGEDGGVDAVFQPDESLEESSAAVGATHFNWYQLLVADNDPLSDAAGVPLQPPYVDPPCGGYGGVDRDWADNLPWYWDEALPPENVAEVDEGNQLTANVEDGALMMSDAPSGPPGTSLEFNTFLVGVGADGSPTSFHGGWTWNADATESSTVVTDVERLPGDAPSDEEFEGLLAKSSCPV